VCVCVFYRRKQLDYGILRERNFSEDIVNIFFFFLVPLLSLSLSFPIVLPKSSKDINQEEKSLFIMQVERGCLNKLMTRCLHGYMHERENGMKKKI
jgi:hypothetical protein